MNIPTIHSNGTARDDLVDQVTTAIGKGTDFIGAMRAMAPHARDYIGRNGSLAEATLENEARIAIAQKILDELQALAEAISNA